MFKLINFNERQRRLWSATGGCHLIFSILALILLPGGVGATQVGKLDPTETLQDFSIFQRDGYTYVASMMNALCGVGVYMAKSRP